jgi:hypothetical protein
VLAVSSVLVHPFGAIKTQRSNKPLLLDSTFDPQVVTTLEKSCQNCHSEKTEWPWYSYVAPISWMIENDVQHGRSHMNLSCWNGYNRTPPGGRSSGGVRAKRGRFASRLEIKNSRGTANSIAIE